MPIFYNDPQYGTITDNQVADRGSTSGTLANITDGKPNTFYETRADGSGGKISFTFPITETTHANSVHVIAENVTHVSTVNLSRANAAIITDQPLSRTFGNRRALVFTHETAGLTAISTSMRVDLTIESTAVATKIYAIKVMQRVLDLSVSGNSRTISGFRPVSQIRNIDIVEDLYGDRDPQTRYGHSFRATTGYTLWNKEDNLTACRQQFNQFQNVMIENPSFILWDLSEEGAFDYESCYQAHLVPGSISLNLRGVNATSFSFTVEQR